MNWYLASFFCLAESLSFCQTPELDAYKSRFPDKDAVVLEHKLRTIIEINKSGELEIVQERYDKTLFLNKKARYYIKDDVSFTSFSEISDLKPVVYTLNNGKYKKNKVKDIQTLDDFGDNTFYDDLKKMVFYYEGLSEGGQTELSYKSKLKEPKFLGGFYFSSYFPSEVSECVVEAPKDVEIGYRLFGDDKDKVTYTKEVKGNTVTHIWRADKLPQVEYEKYAVPLNRHATHMMLYVKNYTYKGNKIQVLNDVSDLYKFYYGFVCDVNTVPDENLIQLADSLTAGLETIDEKAKSIYYWVQDNISYLAIEDGLGGFIPREANLVLKRRYGDCKDMSSILKTLLNHAGVEAHLTWIGTTDIPYTYEELPTPSTDNHMIVAYFNGEEYKVLDATGKRLPFGMPTSFIQGKQALIGVDSSTFKLITVPIVPMEENLTYDSVEVHLNDGIVEGAGTVLYTGYPGKFVGGYLAGLSNEGKKNFYNSSFKKGNNKSTCEVTEARNINNQDSALIIDYAFTIPDYLRTNDDELYLNPFLKKYYSGEQIDLSSSKMDRENLYQEYNRNVVVINIPSDYTVSYLPENQTFEHDKFGFTVNFTHDEAKNQIVLRYNFMIQYLVLEADEFPEWNKFVKQISNIYSELIILKKKQ